MAYRIKGKNGLPIKKDGQFLLGSDIPVVKIEQMDEENMSFLAIGSTEDEDRDKDIIRIAGWQLSNFKKNPVLPWSHNYWEPPVGKALMVKKDVEKKQLIFKPQFDKDDDKARLIFNKYKNGFLNTFSVGFIGVECCLREEGNYWGGREFTKQELLEISPVTVPCNPNANMDVRSLTDDLPPNLTMLGYKQFMCKTESGLFIPVNDTEIYTAPFIIPLGKGIKGIYASMIDNPEDTNKELVGYVFPEDMDENTANEYVKTHNEGKAKVKYFDMGEKQIGEEDFELEVVEEEKEVSDGSIEKEELPEKIEEDKKEETEEVKEEVVEEEQKEAFIEVTVSIVDSDGKKIKSRKEKIQKEDITEEDIDKLFVDILSEKKEENTEIKLSDEQMDELVERVKKSVVKENEVDNNDDNNAEIALSEENDESKNGEHLEFDDSLFSPVSEENNLEEFIEIDDKDFSEVKSQMKKGSLGSVGLKDVLEQSIKNVLQDFSGKLED